VRNAIARFDQVEGVSDAQRDQAGKRILAAAKRFDVEVSESSWRDLAKGGKDRGARSPRGQPPGWSGSGLSMAARARTAVPAGPGCPV
jgi:hypothetical protein